MTTISPSSLPPERFDANQVALSGAITRIWARGSDVFARLDTGNSTEADDLSEQVNRATLLFPGGRLSGQELSLLKGDCLRLAGYLVDLTQSENLQDFLRKAEKLELLDELRSYDIPETALAAHARRATTCVISENLEHLSAAVALNSVCLEGVIAKVWDFDRHRFARLAVYDRNTATTGQEGKNGRPRRIPHYVTIQFPDGQVSGRPVSLKAKDRIRASGYLVDRPYSEDLRNFLLDAHQAEILSKIPNSDDVADLRIRRSSACVVVQTLIQFTR